MCLQASASDLPQLQELWQPSAPSRHHLIVSPEALQQPRDGYKGNAVEIYPPTQNWLTGYLFAWRIMPQYSPGGLGRRKQHVDVKCRDFWLRLVVSDKLSAACSLGR